MEQYCELLSWTTRLPSRLGKVLREREREIRRWISRHARPAPEAPPVVDRLVRRALESLPSGFTCSSWTMERRVHPRNTLYYIGGTCTRRFKFPDPEWIETSNKFGEYTPSYDVDTRLYIMCMRISRIHLCQFCN